ncbi:hypothetical protein GIB67_039303 [Kingdonia uniflora]|uniref:Aminotransferase-like plant mobile domain-containing protein n=1 Tax=Kingdonia uniflora TaxID=39325 RepID=A0A7J7MMG1_9MAGN|nr:hypothetical protein GIB67_039303 [Kingdonia uniflora]
MRLHGTFTAVINVWKKISTILAIRDVVVKIFGSFMDIHLGRYPTQVPYDDAWSVLSNASDREDDITIVRAFILFMIGHLWFQTANDTVPLGYLPVVADLDEASKYDWGYAILASLYHGLDTAVTTGGAIIGISQLLEYWFYEYFEVGHPIVKEDAKFSAYPRLRAWERGNRKKGNDQATNLFILGRYHINHRTIETITWRPWLDSAVSE